MKKRFTLVIIRCLLLLVFIFTVVKLWASDTIPAAGINNSSNIFSRPWIWIATSVVLAIIFLGPHKYEGNHIVIIKKKAIRKTSAKRA